MSRRRVLTGICGALLLVGMGLGLGAALGGQPPAASADLPLAGHQAPPLVGRTLTGGQADLSELRGHVVLVNFWASWCAPCEQELPYLDQVRRQYAGQGLRLLGVNSRDSVSAARKLLSSTGAAITSIHDASGQAGIEWGTFGLPETFVVDASGTVRGRCVGALTPAWVQQQVLPLLAGGSQ